MISWVWDQWSFLSMHCCFHGEYHYTYINYMCLVTQSCLTLCNPMECSPPVSSVHGILQARILEWVAIPFLGWEDEIFPTSPNHGTEPRSPKLKADSSPSEPPGKPQKLYIYCYTNIFYTLENIQKIKDKLKISGYFFLWPLANLILPDSVLMEPTALTDLWNLAWYHYTSSTTVSCPLGSLPNPMGWWGCHGPLVITYMLPRRETGFICVFMALPFTSTQWLPPQFIKVNNHPPG